MRDSDLTTWIGEAARELAEVAAIVGARSPVPACPGWTMRQLVAHVISGLSGWYTYNLTHGAEPLDYAASWTRVATNALSDPDDVRPPRPLRGEHR